MNTDNQFWLGARWYEVLLALLPGFFVIAQKSGMLQPVGGSSFLVSNFYAVPALCLALVLVSLLRERRFAVWSYPALGLVLAISLMTLAGLIYLLAQLLHLSDSVNLFMGSAIVWGTLLVLAVHYRLGSAAPKAFWILLAALIGVSVLQYGIDISASRDQGVEPAMIAAAANTMWLGLYLLPVLIAWRLGREYGTMAALVVLGAEFFFYDTISDPGYAIRMSTQDPTIPQMVNLLPAIGFLIVCPLWALTARSFPSQAIGFLLPTSLAIAVTELLSGAVRPYYTPVMWLRRGLGASEFMLILALAIVAYHAVQSGRVGSENGLRPIQQAT
jgi:hypothetical protein